MNNNYIGIEEAKLIIKSHTKVLSSEDILLKEALGKIVSSNIIATIDQQPFNNSAMDGFAISSNKVNSASLSNKILFNIEKTVIAAGNNVLNVSLNNDSNLAVKIMTGATIPKGYDVVIPVEEAKIDGNTLIVSTTYNSMHNVRAKGEDFKKGEILVQKGDVITPYKAMLLQASGINNISVFKKPKLAIITTGTEFNNENEALTAGKIYNTSALFLEKFFSSNNFEVVNLGNIADNKLDLQSLIENKVLDNFDVVVSTGAVSKGDFDIVPEVLKNYGKVLYHFLSIKPGKPNLLVQLHNGSLWFGLPGNPVSTVIAARLLVYYYYLCATARTELKLLAAVSQDIKKKSNFTVFHNCKLQNIKGELKVSLLEKQGSHIISSLANSDVLIELNANSTFFPKDSLVPFYFLNPAFNFNN